VAEQRTDTVGAGAPGHYGAEGAGVALAEAGIAVAWNVQGDPLRSGCVAVVRDSFGVELPLAANTVARSDALTALWLGPRSWLLVAGEDPPPSDYAAARDALNAAGAALFDVSAARVAWTVSGPRAADVLAKGCPLDFHPRAFTAGTCAQSVYGHVGVLVARCDDAPAFALLAPRSYAREVWHALCESAAQYGCDVLAPAPFGRRAGG
jgi:sarcosine oxidase subunit gamma